MTKIQESWIVKLYTFAIISTFYRVWLSVSDKMILAIAWPDNITFRNAKWSATLTICQSVRQHKHMSTYVCLSILISHNCPPLILRRRNVVKARDDGGGGGEEARPLAGLELEDDVLLWDVKVFGFRWCSTDTVPFWFHSTSTQQHQEGLFKFISTY